MPFIPLTLFGNLCNTAVTSGGTTAPAAGTIETWTVANPSAFPSVEYGAQVMHVADTSPSSSGEMIAILNTSGSTFTVQRGVGNTTPVAHASGFTIVQVVTAEDFASMQYPPWVFPVQRYGAQGDGKIGTGGTGTSGSTTFTDTSANFVNAVAPQGDVGKVIVINVGPGSATTGTNPFCGTISAVNSATSVTLSAALPAAASSAPYIYGTDDTAAINAAVQAASAWAVATGNYKAQVLFAPQNYMLGTLTQTTAYNWSFNSGPYTYNTHIPVPFSGQFDRKLVIDFLGTGDASEPDFWGSTLPSIQGTALVSAVFGTSQPNSTYGQQSVIGTPSAQTNIGNGGISFGNFANVLVNVNGITVVTPFNGQQYGIDFRYAAQANIPNGAVLAFAPVNVSGATVGGPWLRYTNIPSNGVAVGLAMPISGNNDNCNVGLFSVEGIAIGFTAAEHFNCTRISTFYCHHGILISGGTNVHGGAIQYWSCEGCDYGLSTSGLQGSFTLNILNADFETMNTAYINDSSNTLNGYMFYDDLSATPATIGIIGATAYKVMNTRFPSGKWTQNTGPPGIPSPPTAPASGTAQQNTSYRDAVVYASATTGITGVSLGVASGSMNAMGLTGGNNVVVPIRVPSGHWYSVTYTGTLTTTWWLD